MRVRVLTIGHYNHTYILLLQLLLKARLGRTCINHEHSGSLPRTRGTAPRKAQAWSDTSNLVTFPTVLLIIAYGKFWCIGVGSARAKSKQGALVIDRGIHGAIFGQQGIRDFRTEVEQAAACFDMV